MIFKDENYQCDSCDSYCEQCAYEAMFCTKCKDHVVINGTVSILQKYFSFCVTEQERACGSGSFLDLNDNKCKFCDITCIECNGPTSTDCTKCPSSRRYLNNQRCVASCEDGTYLNETVSHCFP